MKKFFITTLITIVVAAAFAISPPGQTVIASANDLFQKLNVFSDMVSIINDNYVDDVDWDKVIDGAYNGLLEELDPHSVYIPKKRLTKINEQFEGEFQGIGIEFDIINHFITVISPIPGAPADKVGIQAGDKIIAIEGKSARDITQQEVFDQLRGPKDSKVDVTVQRQGMQDSLNFTIIRDDIPIMSVLASVMVPGHPDVGYVKLNRFAKNTAQEFEDALEELEAKGMQNLIIDLRNNSGGYMDQAIKIVDKFVPGGQKIVYTKGRIPSANEEFYSTDKATHTTYPIIVLINRGSASASEIVSGALQDLDRAYIVGETSFGKGLVQRQWPMRDGSAIRVTVARYYTPSGRLIQRPYDNGTEAYYEEYAERFMHDNDSTQTTAQDTSKDRPVYHTKHGRVVYGGGGITPDLKVNYDINLTKWTIQLLQNPARVLFEYASSYAAEHPDTKDNFNQFAENFELSQSDIDDLEQLIQDKDIKLNESDFQKDLDYIENIVKAEIASSLWGKDEYYAILLGQDNQVQKALNHFPDAEELASLK